MKRLRGENEIGWKQHISIVMDDSDIAIGMAVACGWKSAMLTSNRRKYSGDSYHDHHCRSARRCVQGRRHALHRRPPRRGSGGTEGSSTSAADGGSPDEAGSRWRGAGGYLGCPPPYGRKVPIL